MYRDAYEYDCPGRRSCRTTYSEVLDPLTAYSPLKPVLRSDPWPEALSAIRCFFDSIRDERAVFYERT